MDAARKTGPSQDDKLLVIACGMIAREVLAVKQQLGLDHIELTCLPAEFHFYPDRIAPAMEKAIAEARAEGYSHIFVGYGDCGTGGQLDKVIEKHGVERMDGPHCFAFYQGQEAYRKVADDDMMSFYMTDFLCRQFAAFFMKPLGLDRHPAIAGGAVPLTLELLSPAHRPIQTTRDLPGFWRGSWADVRADMRGRYPKHVWPENPLEAAATSRAKPRGA